LRCNDLRDRGALDEEECFIGATFVMATGGRGHFYGTHSLVAVERRVALSKHKPRPAPQTFTM